ncbi:pilus assembly protein PilM [Clostridium sp. 19966]|uniref:pilus assembly protein PilM n=1 Tax=Clostridium sp. 19966 TaxID=2768166 RepID=UPI0028DD7E2C|nr:pilus assembly protein PilM [Clostridium sp. 19966]MDT8715483.1 pilus assembly protein PilM [Clostridium sp. 19966]
MEKLKQLNLKKILNTDISQLSLKKKNKEEKKEKPLKPLINKKVVSLDIGSQNTKIVVGKCTSNGITIEKAFTIKTLLNSVYDTVMQNSTVFSIEIEKRLKENGINVKDANCTNNSTTIINREIVVPYAEGEELSTLVNFELQRYLPLNMDNYIVQYNVLEKIREDEADKLRLLAIIYPTKLSKEYMTLLKNAKLKPNALDINYNAVRKLIIGRHIINETEYNPEDTIAVLDMGAESIEVNIYTGENLEFARIIKSGGRHLDQALAEKLGISLNDAETRKIKEADIINYAENEISKALRPEVEEWAEELSKIFQFFRNKKVGNKIDKLFIYGGVSKLKGLREYFQSRFDIPARHINMLSNAQYEADDSDMDLYINAIGAVIRYR